MFDQSEFSDVTTVNHLTNHISKHTSDVNVSKEATTFHWNVNATEFKPLFSNCQV